MIWILLSVLAASSLFVVFKLFDRFNVDRYTAVVFNYLFAGATGLLSYDFNFEQAIECQNCLLFTGSLGLVFVTLFNLIAFVTSKNGTATAVLANKMAFVIPVILSFFIFKESLNWLLVTALLIGLIGTYLAVKPNGKQAHKQSLLWPFVLFIGSGLLDFLLKIGERYILTDWSSSMLTVIIFASAFISGMIYGVVKRKIILSRKNILWAALLGIPNFFSIYFLFKALSAFSEQSVILFPINNVGIILCTTLIAILVFRERLSKLNLIGLCFCILSIAILSYNA
ncbi:DMT family transporter [Salibacteraceae bacterium]|nr:hypothetical protein [Crocinitomicaceae bacterium]MDB0058506.1 DMT family transporter [Salibacteraceae bacterium]